MSVWYTVKGSCSFNISCGLSIKTLVEKELGIEGKCFIRQNVNSHGIVFADFEFVNSIDGVDAAKQIKYFVDEIKRFDPKAKVDLDANIRFLG